MEPAIAEPAAHDAGIVANQQALTEAGHRGVPAGAFEGEPGFGEDGSTRRAEGRSDAPQPPAAPRRGACGSRRRVRSATE